MSAAGLTDLLHVLKGMVANEPVASFVDDRRLADEALNLAATLAEMMRLAMNAREARAEAEERSDAEIDAEIDALEQLYALPYEPDGDR